MKKITYISVATFCLILVNSFSFAQESVTQHLKVGSYNIRYDNHSDRQKGNGWSSRSPVIASLISYVDFDIIGIQEALHHQYQQLDTLLDESYAAVGVGRDDGKRKGEYAPIFYKKTRFDLRDKGVFWLSETPEVPSKGWDAALRRICTWVQLEDKRTHKMVWFFNLHMDHVGKVAREESCKLVLKKMKEIAGDETAILTGDFNVDQENPMYAILAKSNFVGDSYVLADHRYALNGTFNAFDVNLFTNSRIDHIFVTSDLKVKKYAVMTDTYRSPKSKDSDKEIKKGDFPKELSFKEYTVRIPSDHYPVVVDLEW
ncbi:endonuclease/exonuclease/phosphatase family protein [Sphingobacterium sp. LRF_L2]|uniref:endonuclease/exonuclease/phosphatase family protein n=1 Tax=Sphingobacterium sp. LRF_L2 TaxID=3369421 RepID=UPI003F632CE1